MRATLCFLISFLLLPVALLRAADPVPARPSQLPDADVELTSLDRFLDLSDEELDQMQRAIAVVRAMGPEERAILRREVGKFRQLPEGDRRQLRRGWGALDANLQDAWRRMMLAATPTRRAEIQTQVQALSPEKKADFRRRLAEEYLRIEQKK